MTEIFGVPTHLIFGILLDEINWPIDSQAAIAAGAADGILARIHLDECESLWQDIGGEG